MAFSDQIMNWMMGGMVAFTSAMRCLWLRLSSDSLVKMT
jgi:hypothetical protein